MKHAILFSGHLIDRSDRKEPRFPANKEEAVKIAISNQLLKEKEQSKSNALIGIAGGACGGDILFHELCQEMGIPTVIYLAVPFEEYKEKSVSYAGAEWDLRFDNLVKKIPVHILPLEKRNSGKHTIWSETNTWMLHKALKIDPKNVTLIALWNGKGGDGEGGTEHMVDVVNKKGNKTIIIDINKI
jgi:hypothetical protein